MDKYISNIWVHSPADVVKLIVDTNTALLRRATLYECGLLLGTCAVEAALQYRFQRGGGPARGLFQMEPATAYDIFENMLQYTNRPGLVNSLMKIWLNLESVPLFMPLVDELDYHLANNDPFACAMARLHYMRFPEQIPRTVKDLGKYWKTYYNTAGGAGTTQRFRQAWKFHGCTQLLHAFFRDEELLT